MNLGPEEFGRFYAAEAAKYDAAAGVIPDVYAEGKMRLGLHGQARLDSPAPHRYLCPSCVATGELWQPNELDAINAALGQRQTCES
jgi:hypothetical protein